MQSDPEVSVLLYYFHDIQNLFDMKTVKFSAQAQSLWYRSTEWASDLCPAIPIIEIFLFRKIDSWAIMYFNTRLNFKIYFSTSKDTGLIYCISLHEFF